jgi:hypothetical protein
MVDSIYTSTGRQRISSVCLQHTDNRASLEIAQESYAPERSYLVSIAATGGNTTVVAAVTGRSIAVDSYVVVASGASSIRFLSNSTGLTGTMMIGGSGGISAPSSNSSLFSTSSGEALIINTTSSVAGHLSYRIV